MNVIRIAAFSDGDAGGNPAGIVLCEELPAAELMQTCAADVGFAETAFAAPLAGGDGWRVRYFSPETEVPFCGHATIALGAALAGKEGDGVFALKLNEAEISVEGQQQGGAITSALQSPPTTSAKLDRAAIDAVLGLFSLQHDQLDAAIPPARIHGGANHLMIALKDRSALAAMDYDLDAGRDFMRRDELVTIMLVYCRDARNFDVRNAFASGGVFEDPATGAAAAAFAGYLRDLEWHHSGRIDIVQGEDMGARSLITAEFDAEPGTSIRISGTTRNMV